SAEPPHLHSFPTRRSSDLARRGDADAGREGGRGAADPDEEREGGKAEKGERREGGEAGEAGQACGRQAREGEATAEAALHPSSRSEEHTSELQSLAYLVCR